MKLSEICEILQATVKTGSDKMEMEIDCGAASDLMSDILRFPKEQTILITGLCTTQIVRTAVIAGLMAVVVVRGKEPDEEMIQQARENDLPLLCTHLNMFSSCGRLYSNGLKPIR